MPAPGPHHGGGRSPGRRSFAALVELRAVARGSPPGGCGCGSSAGRGGSCGASRGAAACSRRSRRCARPGPLVISRIRSASRIASSTSCVIMNTVWRVAAQIAQQLVLDRAARQRVERAERLVHQQHLRARSRTRARCRRAASCRPRAATGFLCSAPVRPTRSMYFWLCVAHLRAVPVGPARRTAKATLPSAVSHGIRRGSGRSRRGRATGPATSRPSTNTSPARGRVEAGQDVEDGGLAAAGVADHADELALLDREVDVLEDHVAAGRGRKRLREVLDLQERVRLIRRRSPRAAAGPSSSRAACRPGRSPGSRRSRWQIERLFHSFQTK